MLGLSLLGAVLVGIAIIGKKLRFILRSIPSDSLYVLISRDTENIEWLIPCLCRHSLAWRLKIFLPARGERKRILEKLALKYGFEIIKQVPADSRYIITLDQNSTPAKIKKRLRAMRNNAPRKENRLVRRI
jgi:hypothetical protein